MNEIDLGIPRDKIAEYTVINLIITVTFTAS